MRDHARIYGLVLRYASMSAAVRREDQVVAHFVIATVIRPSPSMTGCRCACAHIDDSDCRPRCAARYSTWAAADNTVGLGEFAAAGVRLGGRLPCSTARGD
jgi:hypothetical protein